MRPHRGLRDAGRRRRTLLVSDTGVGIAPEHMPHLFERFYKVAFAREAESTGVIRRGARQVPQTDAALAGSFQ